MRVNIYAEEMTQRVEIVRKEIPGEGTFTGIRFYLELPATKMHWDSPHSDRMEVPVQVRGPFIHRPGDDDSAAVTFLGKRELRAALATAIELLDSSKE